MSLPLTVPRPVASLYRKISVAGVAQQAAGLNAGVTVEIQANATGSREQLYTSQAANSASAGNTTSSDHGQGSARQPQSDSHTALPFRSPPEVQGRTALSTYGSCTCQQQCCMQLLFSALTSVLR